MDLILIRHGETQFNADGIVQGWLDTQLNENGKRQAKAAAEQFNSEIDAIYSSDLLRAKQTAAEFTKKYKEVPYFEDERLRERDFGEASGNYAKDYDWGEFWISNETVSIPNAETLTAYTQRVASFLDSLKQTSYKKVLIVSHGGTINRTEAILVEGHVHTFHENTSIINLTLQ